LKNPAELGRFHGRGMGRPEEPTAPVQLVVRRFRTYRAHGIGTVVFPLIVALIAVAEPAWARRSLPA